MKMIKMKKMVVTAVVMVLCSVGFVTQAQEQTFADRWAAKMTQQYTQELELTEEQAVKVHEILLTTAKKGEEIKETETGDAQTKALWRMGQDRIKQLNEVLTPEQQKKFKESRDKKK